jgi:tRNA-dihydrouridine synthase
MIGRLAVKEPWVFAEAVGQAAARPGLEETALRFLDLLARYQPPEFHLSRARRFFRYYCDNFTWAEYLRNKINREETLAGICRVISGYCRENLQP